MVKVNIGREYREYARTYPTIYDAIRGIAAEIVRGEIANNGIDSDNGKLIMTRGAVYAACTAFFNAHKNPTITPACQAQAMRDWQKWCERIKH